LYKSIKRLQAASPGIKHSMNDL